MRVALAEDSVLLRDGLARLLNAEGFEVVAQCPDAAELMRKLSTYPVDVAILERDGPGDRLSGTVAVLGGIFGAG